jgi:copper homeostasis protein
MIELVEACVDSLETAFAAQAAGAGRLELCGPGEGGLTPSPGLLASVMAVATVPVHVMIRAREGDFEYSGAEFSAMVDSVVAAREAGAKGVVFGVLLEDATIDLARMAELIVTAWPLRVCCHRAFDRTPDPDAALDDLLALGMDVVLTSGHARTAIDGAPTLARHVQRAAGRMRILAGGNVRAGNVRALMEATGVRHVHARATEPAAFADLMRACGEINSRSRADTSTSP